LRSLNGKVYNVCFSVARHNSPLPLRGAVSLCNCAASFSSVIAGLAKPAEAISAKPLCLCEECSDEAIQVETIGSS
jgi:hypothetical protein